MRDGERGAHRRKIGQAGQIGEEFVIGDAHRVQVAEGHHGLLRRDQTPGQSDVVGHSLDVVNVVVDCDQDTLLVTARPRGPACHNGTLTCFGDEPRSAATSIAFLAKLEAVVAQRATEKPEASYTARLLEKGVTRVAQKVGEEGVELALAAAVENDDKVIGESADLLFHLLVLLRARGVGLDQVVNELEKRHQK